MRTPLGFHRWLGDHGPYNTNGSPSNRENTTNDVSGKKTSKIKPRMLQAGQWNPVQSCTSFAQQSTAALQKFQATIQRLLKVMVIVKCALPWQCFTELDNGRPVKPQQAVDGPSSNTTRKLRVQWRHPFERTVNRMTFWKRSLLRKCLRLSLDNYRSYHSVDERVSAVNVSNRNYIFWTQPAKFQSPEYPGNMVQKTRFLLESNYKASPFIITKIMKPQFSLGQSPVQSLITG